MPDLELRLRDQFLEVLIDGEKPKAIAINLACIVSIGALDWKEGLSPKEVSDIEARLGGLEGQETVAIFSSQALPLLEGVPSWIRTYDPNEAGMMLQFDRGQFNWPNQYVYWFGEEMLNELRMRLGLC